MNIVLIGYRGTGKTAVGQVLADRLGWPLLNLDDLIVKRAGQTIPQIVAAHGWEHFRDLETEITLECAQKDQSILDTGGGCILRPQNVAALKRNGILFWLRASVPTIVERIRADDQRPSLTGAKSFTDEVAQVLKERHDKYKGAADHEIHTDDLSVSQVADQILAKYNEISRGAGWEPQSSADR